MITRIEINITELCNLTCGFCPRGTWYPNQNLHMSLETANEIGRQMASLKHIPNLSIAGRGEPTLHPQFSDILKTFFSYNIPVLLSTNGKRFDKHLEEISKCYFLVYDVYSEEEEDFLEAVEKVKDLPCENKMVHLKSDDGTLKYMWRNGEFEVVNKGFLYNRVGGIGEEYNEKLRFRNKERTTWCHFAEEELFIDWNGNYNLCCNDWSGKALSNIYRQDIETYFRKNRDLQAYRNGIRSKKRLSPCDVCSI